MSRFARTKSAFTQDPPSVIVEMGSFCHPCQGQLVCSRVPSQNKIPYFNAAIYLKNKTQIGKVDEILGPLNQLYFTVKPLESIPATSFVPGDILYISSDKLLPLERLLPKPQGVKPMKPLNMQGKLPNRKTSRGGGFAGRRGSRGGARSRGGFYGTSSRGGGFRRGGNFRGGLRSRGRGHS